MEPITRTTVLLLGLAIVTATWEAAYGSDASSGASRPDSLTSVARSRSCYGAGSFRGASTGLPSLQSIGTTERYQERPWSLLPW
jgi:hypothetical protein